MSDRSPPNPLSSSLSLKSAHYRDGYWLCLFCVGLAIAIQYLASGFLKYSPDDPNLIYRVNQLRAWSIPLLMCSLIPLYFALRNVVQLDDAGVSLRRWGRWRTYSWGALCSAHLRYCDECRCLKIDDGGRSFCFSLRSLSGDDRNRFFDQLALGGVVAEPFVPRGVHRLHPWWSGTYYEFSDCGIAVVKPGERRDYTWDEIASACILHFPKNKTAVRSLSVELGTETIQLCHQCCSLRGETACQCSILRPVSALLQAHLDPDRLSVTHQSLRLDDLETEGDLDRYERHQRAGLWELHAVFRVIGGFFALMGTACAVLGAFQLDQHPSGSWLGVLCGWSITVGAGALLAFGAPRFFERMILSPIKSRRRELAERSASQHTTPSRSIRSH